MGKPAVEYLIHSLDRTIGSFLLILAAVKWVEMWNFYAAMEAFVFQGLRAGPVAVIMATFLTAIYLTTSGLVLVFLRQPIARYETMFPNIFSVFAAFFVYTFSILPRPPEYVAPVLLSLVLTIAGYTLILVSFLYLRSSYSVTPQVRAFVDKGLYYYIRHPMYVGNIFTFAGLTLLVGGVSAVLVLFAASALQVVRARREESLLRRWVPEYTLYSRRTGMFLPFIGKRPIILTATIPVAGLLFYSAAAISAPPRPDPMLPRKCDAWYNKAISGRWFSERDISQFQDASNNEFLDLSPQCRRMSRLRDICSERYGALIDGGNHSSLFNFNKFADTKGCMSVVGPEQTCRWLEDLSSERVKLNPPRPALLAQCLNAQLRRRFLSLIGAAL